MKYFKTHDIQGRLPYEFNEEIAYRIGKSYVRFLSPAEVVIGRDVRLSSESISSAIISALADSGVDVLDIGLCGTEMVHFATAHLNADGGIMVTADHTAAQYNGMKLFRKRSKPSSKGFNGIRDMAAAGKSVRSEVKGMVSRVNIGKHYMDYLLNYVDVRKLRHLKIVTNAGNGCAGMVIDVLEQILLPIKFIKLRNYPDGSFPHGAPDLLLSGFHGETIDAIKENNADIGVAWHSDLDRCYFFDSAGNFIEGHQIAGLLSVSILDRYQKSKVVNDSWLDLKALERISAVDRLSLVSKRRHAPDERFAASFYDEEVSSQAYFREFAHYNSGMIPWLMVVNLMCKTGKSLSCLIEESLPAL